MLVPNPGSSQAVLFGCCCPQAENNFGTTSPLPPDGWYLDVDCFVHIAPSLADPFDLCDDD